MSNTPSIDRRHLRFVLDELLQVETLCRLPRFAEHSRATFEAAIDAAEALAEAKFAPHNRLSDTQEPQWLDGRVRIVPEVKAALDAYAGAGFPAMTADAEEGGMQLPYTVALACDAMFAAANVATAGYPMLAHGVSHLLKAHGSAEQQRRYRQPLIEGRYLGTMCLSEPQAGSSLGDIQCLATPAGDGSYRLRGAKMWISGGEHELSENIVHLVLARTPGAPPGVKGLSLFIVPKFRVDADGRLGERNDVLLAGINHKLGQRGIVNTFLKFGEHDDCRAELVGREQQGLAQMFHMMNEARIGVGIGAIALGSAGYRYALAYARERRQGRHPEQKDPASAPIALIEHADVRRMLLQQKAYTQGALALALFAATLVDARDQDADPQARGEAASLLDLLTPVVKAWSGEWCVRANDLAIQVLGGYGYTREYPVEQAWRDNRLNPIHEGANGIQAIDLLGRKAMQDQGAALARLLALIEKTRQQAMALPAWQEEAAALVHYSALVSESTRAVADRLGAGEWRLGLANASNYLGLVGHVCIAWTWLRAALAAEAALPAATETDRPFYRGQQAACRFFFRHELPRVEVDARLLRTLDRTTLDMPTDGF